ncbi:hypothetical protein AAHA92_01272 [Salvia divinorum]|uniref:Retrotransposon gag domain-containing protein n=1 Tax=Salvia divinorum TaxID=28513 RepID=A0ABD1IPP6_SALDI
MHWNQRFGRWNNVQNWRDTESNWRIREVAAPVTTRSGLITAEPVPLSSGSEGDPETPHLIKEESDLFSDFEEEDMTALHEDDLEIGSLNAHLNGEPSGAIVLTPGQAGIEVKNNVLAVMPHFYGRRIDNPYEFLHEFCRLCEIQRRPAGSSEEDYRLRALPFALKGEADTWFMRLPPNSIRT